MRAALLIASFAVTLATVGKCVSQQMSPSSQQEPEAAVLKLYRQVVARKPLGIPLGKDRNAIWPLLSQKLIEQMQAAKDCERDYFHQYPDPNLKPEFDWLEFGLFSGGNEQADPSLFAMRRSVRQKDGSYEVGVKLTYWSDFEKYRRPRGPKYDWNWDVVVFVTREDNHYVVNDVLYSKVYPEDAELRLSQLLGRGCKDGKWVGYPVK